MEPYLHSFEKFINQTHVYIGPDYPYDTVPTLPYCKALFVDNSDIRKIGDLPQCINADITTAHYTLNNKVIGNLSEIGDMPQCEHLKISAKALDKIGRLDNCSTINVYNEIQGHLTHLERCDHISAIIRDINGSIIYIGTDNMSLKDTIKSIIKFNESLKGIDFKNSEAFIDHGLGINNLSGFTFNRIDLSTSLFVGLDLTGSNFYNCTTLGTHFTDCSMKACILRDMSGARFSNCDVRYSDLSNSQININDLISIDKSCILKNVRIIRTDAHGNNIVESKKDSETLIQKHVKTVINKTVIANRIAEQNYFTRCWHELNMLDSFDNFKKNFKTHSSSPVIHSVRAELLRRDTGESQKQYIQDLKNNHLKI